MAEINASGSNGKYRRGRQRSKKLSTRVDLTPMVDLGFLLITFFIFATSMSKPKVMKVILPADAPNSMPVPESGVLTLIPVANDSLYCYEGNDPSIGSYVSEKMIRSVIMRKKQSADPGKFIVVLKPSSQCTYKNVVNLLDEMRICDVKRYVMTGAEKSELLAMKAR